MLVELWRVVFNSVKPKEDISEQYQFVQWLKKHKRVQSVIARENGYYYLEMNYNTEEVEIFSNKLSFPNYKEFGNKNNSLLIQVPNKSLQLLKYEFDYAFTAADIEEERKLEITKRYKNSLPFSIKLIHQGSYL